MSDYRKYESAPNLTFKGVVDPSESVVGAKKDDLWGNSVTGELFACEVETFGSQVWYGSQGSRVPVLVDPILLPTHPNIVAMYTMDNIVGSTLIDETGNNNGVLIGAPLTIEGVLDNGLQCNGTSQRVDFSNITTISSLTQGAVSCWVKPGLFFVGDEYFLSLSRNTAGATSLTGTLNFRVSDTGILSLVHTNSANSVVGDVRGGSATADIWNHVVIQSNGSAYEFYVNGTSVTLTVVTGSAYSGWFNTNTPQSANIGFNATADVSGGYKGAKVDQFRIFNRALTQQEVTALYNEGIP